MGEKMRPKTFSIVPRRENPQDIIMLPPEKFGGKILLFWVCYFLILATGGYCGCVFLWGQL